MFVEAKKSRETCVLVYAFAFCWWLLQSIQKPPFREKKIYRWKNEIYACHQQNANNQAVSVLQLNGASIVSS